MKCLPPHEVKVGGIIEVPWQGFHSEVLFGSLRFMEDIKNQPNVRDGYYLKFSDNTAGDDKKLGNPLRRVGRKGGG